MNILLFSAQSLLGASGVSGSETMCVCGGVTVGEALPSWTPAGSWEPGKEKCLSGNPRVHGQGHQPPPENFSG